MHLNKITRLCWLRAEKPMHINSQPVYVAKIIVQLATQLVQNVIVMMNP